MKQILHDNGPHNEVIRLLESEAAIGINPPIVVNRYVARCVTPKLFLDSTGCTHIGRECVCGSDISSSVIAMCTSSSSGMYLGTLCIARPAETGPLRFLATRIVVKPLREGCCFECHPWLGCDR